MNAIAQGALGWTPRFSGEWPPRLSVELGAAVALSRTRPFDLAADAIGSSSDAPRPLRRSAPAPQAAARGRALIVEDDPTSRTALGYLLAHHGWNATEAATLGSGAQMLDSARPHVLILDLMLPDGDGADLLRRVRAERLPIRVAVVSGVGDPQRLAAVNQLGPDAMFHKPLDVHAFLKWLDRAAAPSD